MRYDSIFNQKSSLTMRVNRHCAKIPEGDKVSPDHDINVRVYYGTELNSYSQRAEARLVCEVPMSRGALQQLATDLWDSGIYPKQAILNAQRTRESIALTDALLGEGLNPKDVEP